MSNVLHHQQQVVLSFTHLICLSLSSPQNHTITYYIYPSQQQRRNDHQIILFKKKELIFFFIDNTNININISAHTSQLTHRNTQHHISLQNHHHPHSVHHVHHEIQ